MTRREISILIIDQASCMTGIEAHNIKEADNFRDDLGMDSLDQLELILQVERIFEVNVPDVEVSNIKTVKDAVDIIYDKYKST